MGTDIHSIGQIKINNKWETKICRVGGDERCYDTFAVLADVRNGYGFAGCITGDGWIVLFPPRGLPDDLYVLDGEFVPIPPFRDPWQNSDEPYRTECWLGDHSHSWLTLGELKQILSHYERKEHTIIGMITKEDNEALNNGILPSSWCSYTSNKNYVNASWKVPAISRLWSLINIVEKLEKLKNSYGVNDDEVRMIFGFDS